MLKIILIFAISVSAQAVTTDKFIKLTSKSNKSLYTALTDGTIGNPTWVREVPTGSGTSFTLANTPISNASVSIIIDGLTISEFTVSGTSVTLSTALQTGQDIYAIYQK